MKMIFSSNVTYLNNKESIFAWIQREDVVNPIRYMLNRNKILFSEFILDVTNSFTYLTMVVTARANLMQQDICKMLIGE